MPKTPRAASTEHSERYRTWIGTIPYTDDMKLPIDLSSYAIIKYACYQVEQGESTGYKHIQCFVQFKNKQSLSKLKELFGKEAHWENCNNFVASRDYCMKPDTRIRGPWEYGKFQGPGHRTDIETPVQEIIARKPIAEVAEAHPVAFVKYHRGFKELANTLIKKRDSKIPIEVIIYYGPTGTGKTRTARESFPDAYIKHPKTKWWDGYEGQQTVIIDEFVGDFPVEEFKSYFDRYPIKAEVKGGTVELAFTRAIFTTNHDPVYWYPDRHFETINRRITKVVYFESTDVKHEYNSLIEWKNKSKI